MRYRRKLVETQAAERKPSAEILETANIQIGPTWPRDVFGMSGHRTAASSDSRKKAPPPEMAELAKGLHAKKIPELELALEGKWNNHHRFLFGAQLHDWKAGGKRTCATLNNASGRI